MGKGESFSTNDAGYIHCPCGKKKNKTSTHNLYCTQKLTKN